MSDSSTVCSMFEYLYVDCVYLRCNLAVHVSLCVFEVGLIRRKLCSFSNVGLVICVRKSLNLFAHF